MLLKISSRLQESAGVAHCVVLIHVRDTIDSHFLKLKYIAGLSDRNTQISNSQIPNTQITSAHIAGLSDRKPEAPQGELRTRRLRPSIGL